MYDKYFSQPRPYNFIVFKALFSKELLDNNGVTKTSRSRKESSNNRGMAPIASADKVKAVSRIK